jgi:hypothetical protein
LLAELTEIEDPEPLRVAMQAKLTVLIAAACARRGHVKLADSLLRQPTPESGDADLGVLRAVALRALGRHADAAPMLDEAGKSAAGRRSILSHARLLNP